MKKKIGMIGVDAGLCWIGDPCYVFGEDATKKWPKWSDFCDTIKDEYPTIQQYDYPKGHEGLGVLVSTGYGDGLYPVYAEIEDGRVKSVTVHFMEDAEDAEMKLNDDEYEGEGEDF